MMSGDTIGELEANSDTLPQLISVARVAIRFDCAERTIYRWIKAGVFQPVRVGRTVRIRADEVNALIASRMTVHILRGR